ncbi:hypothetical protein C1645_819011 [Glomus cerebriforme]|uniref:Uncharacterized protein n=1 Tax=Glomus cerebriforme TaxID=658196 RepID=A0A397TBQ2_9GLOM|nr:hypothetical protein C1645_819011 [Glomus cerebriforme]
MLADESSITHNYALEKTIRLAENLAGYPKNVIKNEIVTNFVSKAAINLSNFKWIHYGKSTAQLELILRAMSSILHILSQLVSMISANTRTSLYKSVSKFWEIYRNTNYVNANITFTLREIRTCLRKIKDDQSNVNIVLGQSSNIIDAVCKVVQSEYIAAFSAVTTALNFEYAAGEWYFNWEDIRGKYFRLRQKSLEKQSLDINCELKRIKKFYKELYDLSINEFKKVKRKNTKYRNFEYKMLKSGGALTGTSLPDHIDTILIGYLDLIQRLFQEFFPHIKEFIEEISSFCDHIIETNIKKQLTFKALEILYVIYVINENIEITNEIKSNFKNCFITSIPFSSLQKPNDILITLPSSSNIPPDTTSAFTSFSTPPQSPVSLFQEENQRQQRRLKFRKVKIPLSNFQKIRQQKLSNARKRIIDDVINLFDDRHMINKNIREIKTEYDELLRDADSNEDSYSILLKLKEMFKVPLLPPLTFNEPIELLPFPNNTINIITKNKIQAKNVNNPPNSHLKVKVYDFKNHEDNENESDNSSIKDHEDNRNEEFKKSENERIQRN